MLRFRTPGRVAVLSLLVLSGCGAAAMPTLNKNARGVKVGKKDAPEHCTELAPVTGVHGTGCGSLGREGSYEGAYIDLRNKAAALGATYVRVDFARPPHTEAGCYVNEFTILGVAFNCAVAEE